MQDNNNKEKIATDTAFTAPPASTFTISDQIAAAALSAFASLPKTGKPQPFEHTAFAAIALTFPPSGHAATCLGLQNIYNNAATATAFCTSPLIIAMATGTKCLPGSKRAADGSALNDCHAEVLARRAFLRWLYDEIQYIAAAAPEKGRISPVSLVLSIESETNRVEVVEGVKIHIFTSHPPCGDAAIGVDAAVEADAGAVGVDVTRAGATTGQSSSCGCADPSSGSIITLINPNNTTTMGNGVGRTGAKPIVKRFKPNDNDDKTNISSNTTATAPRTGVSTTTNNNNNNNTSGGDWVLPQAHDVESYAAAQMTGIVRRKPGRGDPTLSVSCSDKIAKWSLLGIQGALLSSLLAKPLFLTSLVVGAPQIEDLSLSKDISKVSITLDLDGERSSGIEMTENALKRAFQERTTPLRTQISNTSTSFFPPAPPPVLETHAVALAAFELDKLGLLAGEVRRVPCGTSITWRASPSATWRLKQAKEAHQWKGSFIINRGGGGGGGGGSGGITLRASSLPLILPSMLITEGFSEAITGLFGCKAGAARRGADPIPPERQSALCRAALFRRFIQVSTALHRNKTDGDGSTSIKDRKVTYAEAKDEAGTASGYNLRWKEIMAAAVPVTGQSSSSPFDGWIEKPSLGSEFYIT